jgi:glycine oxidase
LTEQTNQQPEPQLDAIVVGGGVIGLTCAWRMAREGLRVRLLERDRPGAGASGIAAGMIAPVGESSWGEEELLADALASHGQWPLFARELAADSGRDPGLRISGALHVALDRDEAGELRRRHELMSSLDLDARWLGSKEARRLEPALSPDTLAAIHAPAEASIEPRPLLEALLKAAIYRDVEVLSGAEVLDAIIGADRLLGVVDSRGREHRAPITVLAAGAWSGAAEWLPERARPGVRPVKGQILTLRDRSGEAPCARIVASERVYLVPRAGGRLVVGATVEEMGFDTVVTAGGVHELLREAYRALPDVAEMELVASEAGLRPGTADNAPLVGEGEIDGLILATGHYRHGVLLAPLTGARITAAAKAALRTEEVWAG